MFEQIIETCATPHVTVTECLGNLVVRGADEERIAVHARGAEGEASLEQEGEAFTLKARVDCFLTCPPDTTLTVRAVRGNLKIEGVKGPVAIGTVHGNAKLRAVGPVVLEQTFGNLSVRQTAGDLSAQVARGNARIRQVDGSASLEQIDGNLAIEGVRGDLAASRVWGNARLGPPFSPGAVFSLSVGGNLTIRLPADSSLRLAFHAGGGVHSRVPGLALEKIEGETQSILGNGEASLEAQVDGRVSLRLSELGDHLADDLPFDFVADMEGLSAQIEAQIAAATAELEARLEESLGRIDSEEARLRVERVAEKTRQKAQKEAEKARRKAQHETEKARLRAERAERRWRRASGQRPRPRSKLISDEEQMRVLRLVEEGKISPEQAADLLAAMEGR
ncbi:MAG: hypothetical protein DRJ03_17475 [Chloroflexi bacterium]|nr:MAG: hypothetical protein DRI81_01190 [Chloroflexota bacterium]RLC83334.1 MAG: hypothetical protein DRJ03_17475 [Chloroflexota bacterium]